MAGRMQNGQKVQGLGDRSGKTLFRKNLVGGTQLGEGAFTTEREVRGGRGIDSNWSKKLGVLQH